MDKGQEPSNSESAALRCFPVPDRRGVRAIQIPPPLTVPHSFPPALEQPAADIKANTENWIRSIKLVECIKTKEHFLSAHVMRNICMWHG
jgi:hypothetical protein